MTEIFLLLPEAEPLEHKWMCNTQDFLEEQAFKKFYTEFENRIFEIDDSECYNLLYSKNNFEKFLTEFEVLRDLYPYSPRLIFEEFFRDRDSINWEENQLYKIDTDYLFYHEKINIPSLCELAERQLCKEKNCVLFNHYAINIHKDLHIVFGEHDKIIPVLPKEQKEVREWFSQYRKPPRVFNCSPKHGENRQELHIAANGEKISPLRCSREHAQDLLNTALGTCLDELFNIDTQNEQQYFIVFKREGEIPQNQYHGYHVEIDDKSVPAEIKKMFNN